MTGLEPWASPVIRSFVRVLVRSHQGSFCAKARVKLECLHSNLTTLANVRNSQSVFLIVLGKRLIGTQYLQGKWNVGRMGAQVFCQGDAGKVSFEFSSLLWRLRRLENGIECVNAVEFCLRVC